MLKRIMWLTRILKRIEKKIRIIRAKRALKVLWASAWFQGKGWGTGRGYMQGPNIIMVDHDELITICVEESGYLVIHEFSRTKDTSLARNAENHLKGSSFIKRFYE